MNDMTPSFESVYDALNMRPFAEAKLIQERAKALHETLKTLQWDKFKIERPEWIRISGSEKSYPIVHYSFGDQRRSTENAHNPFAIKKSLSETEGTSIDREDIHYFAKVCQIGISLIPQFWPKRDDLIQALKKADTHLDLLNEVWWLARWTKIDWSATQYEYRLRTRELTSKFRKKKIDWQLRGIDGWVLNIEVKNFTRSNADRIYDKVPAFYRANGHANDGEIDTDDPRLKFRNSVEREINVLAITWYDEIGTMLEKWIQEFLDASEFSSPELKSEFADKIDAVIIWSRADRRRNGWRSFFPRFRDVSAKRRALVRYLVEPDSEDRNRPFFQTSVLGLADAVEMAEGNRIRIVRP